MDTDFYTPHDMEIRKMEKDIKELPDIPESIITYLKSIYPNELPMKQLTDYEQGILTGQQQVINHLDSIIWRNDEE